MALTPTTKLKTSGGTLSGQLNFSGTTHAGLKLLSLTTVQRDALTPANGMLIYNTTTATVQKYEAGAWVNSGTPAAHASTHQNNGADEISVAGLSGLLADGQTPLAHIASHAPGGSDALPWTTIHGRGTTGAKPAAAAGNAGYLYFDTTLAKLQRSTGSAWEDVAEPGAVTSYSLTATTTDATQTELLTAASARLTLPDNTAWGFTAMFTGRYNGTAGAAWTARDSNRTWYNIASSDDGTKLAATVNNGQIYTSTDSGVTWTARMTDANRYWYGIASSSDGTKLAAVNVNGQIYTSTDSGVTWTARDSNRDWRNIASSADGTKLAAVVDAGQIYTSTDSGANWTARDSNRTWQSISSSSDGTKLAATVFNGQIYTSTDSGVTWTARESIRNWRNIASSADGTKLAAGAEGGQIYTSTDSGATWTAQASGNRTWYGIASSSDGTKLAATVNNGQIYTSTDSGVTWTARESNRAWDGIASSSDGTKLAAGHTGGQIYTLTITPAASETCEFKGQAVRDSGAASMSISALQENPIGDNTAGRFVCQADTTNGALQFLATGSSAQTWKWGVSIQTVEVTP